MGASSTKAVESKRLLREGRDWFRNQSSSLSSSSASSLRTITIRPEELLQALSRLMGKSKAPKSYAVARGRVSGIYSTWAETEAQVKGYPGANHKSFGIKAEAEVYMASHGHGLHQQPPAPLPVRRPSPPPRRPPQIQTTDFAPPIVPPARRAPSHPRQRRPPPSPRSPNHLPASSFASSSRSVDPPYRVPAGPSSRREAAENQPCDPAVGFMIQVGVEGYKKYDVPSDERHNREQDGPFPPP